MAEPHGPALPKDAPLSVASNVCGNRLGTEEEQRADGGAMKPLTKDDLVAFLASGCKPKAAWRIGVENEKFGFQLDTVKPMTLNHIGELLEGMASRFGYDRITESDTTAGLQKDGVSVTLEPGGQFELSGAPLEDIHAVKRELDTHLKQVNTVGKELGLGFAGMGYEPKWPMSERPAVDKDGRFDAAIKYLKDMPGDEVFEVMYQTCTAQVNLDFDSEQDMINKFRVALSLQPIATALFANSPFSDGKPNGYLSFRSDTWLRFDDSRTGVLPFVFDDNFGFEKYTEYAMNVPMMMVHRNNKWNYVGGSFMDFMAGKLKGFEGETPTLEDWINHLGNLYPEVRLKKYMEMRGADCGPGPFITALPAFWVGLLYDEESLKGALDIIRDWTNDDRDMLRNETPKQGLRVPFKGGLVKDVAQEVVKLAKEGLVRRGRNEEGFLAPIEEVANSGVTLAERMLKLYYDKWDRKVDPIFDELRL